MMTTLEYQEALRQAFVRQNERDRAALTQREQNQAHRAAMETARQQHEETITQINDVLAQINALVQRLRQ